LTPSSPSQLLRPILENASLQHVKQPHRNTQ